MLKAVSRQETVPTLLELQSKSSKRMQLMRELHELQGDVQAKAPRRSMTTRYSRPTAELAYR